MEREERRFNPKEHIVKLVRTNRTTGEKITSDYLEAKWRLVWAKEEHPDWRIFPQVTLFPASENSIPESALASVEIWEGDKVIAREFGYCEKKDFARFVEKAITTALGRALALLGYGTQWAQEFEEDLVEEGTSDSPIQVVEMTEEDNHAPSEKQIGLIHSLVKAIKMTEDEYRKLLKEKFGITSARELRGKQIQELIDFLKEQARILKEQK